MSEFRTRLGESSQAFRAVFANRELRKLQLAFVGSITGEWGFLVALVVYANAHGGAKAISLVLVIRWVAAALTAPWLAYFADRYRRERVMLVADLSRVVAMLGMAAAAFTGAPAAIVFVLAGLHGRRIEDVPAGTGRAAAAARRLAGGAHGRERDLDSDRERRLVPRAGARGAAARGGERRLGLRRGCAHAGVVGDPRPADPQPARASAPGGAPERVPEGRRRGSARSGRSPTRASIVFLYFCQTVVAGALRVLIVVTALELLDIGDSGLGFLNAAVGIGGLIGVGVTFALVGPASGSPPTSGSASS